MEPEVVMNLWVFIQSVGPLSVIHELAVRPYVMTGTDDEKLRLLKELGISDFHFARRFPLPADRYYLKIIEKDGAIIASSGDTMDRGTNVRGGLALLRPDISGMHQVEYFTEALDVIEKSLPSRRLGIAGPETEMPKVNRENLLSVITNVDVDGEGNQVPRVDDPRRNSSPSPVANLWMFHDDKAKVIYALSGRAYMVHGSDSENTRILETLAPYDFSMVSALPIPQELSTTLHAKSRKGVVAVSSDGKYNRELFNGVFQAFEHEIPTGIGIDRKITNRMTISASKMMWVATRITERSANVADTAPIQLVESPRRTPASVQTTEVTGPIRTRKSVFRRLFEIWNASEETAMSDREEITLWDSFELDGMFFPVAPDFRSFCQSVRTAPLLALRVSFASTKPLVEKAYCAIPYSPRQERSALAGASIVCEQCRAEYSVATMAVLTTYKVMHCAECPSQNGFLVVEIPSPDWFGEGDVAAIWEYRRALANQVWSVWRKTHSEIVITCGECRTTQRSGTGAFYGMGLICDACIPSHEPRSLEYLREHALDLVQEVRKGRALAQGREIRIEKCQQMRLLNWVAGAQGLPVEDLIMRIQL